MGWIRTRDPDGDYIYGPEEWHYPEEYVFECKECGIKYSFADWLEAGEEPSSTLCPRCGQEERQ